jgi:hypothetical protein
MFGLKARRATSKSRHKLQLLDFIVGFAVVGAVVVLITQAITPTASIEPEDGAKTSQVTTLTNASASGGSNVKFGAGSTPPPPSAWKPLATKPGGWAWQWQLTGTVNETVLDGVSNPNKMYDIDMFDASSALISRLKAKNIYVVCYVESGDWVQSRPDSGDFAPSILSTNKLSDFDEYYINVSALDGPAGPTGKTLRQIMTARLQTAKNKGCEGIEPDLDDLQTYPTQPFKITQAQQVAYNTFLIQTGHAMGMSVGLKNGPDPGGTFDTQMYNAGADWVLNEECNQFDECGGYNVFIAGGRAVFQVEYLDNQNVPYGGTNGTCARNNQAGFDGIVKDSSSTLSALPRTPCRVGN